MRIRPHLRRRARLLRACTVCGRPSATNRCPEHAKGTPYGSAHQRIRAQLLAEESLCWRCGKPGTAADPLVAGHVVGVVDGGPTARINYRAEHRSCNSRAGAAVV